MLHMVKSEHDDDDYGDDGDDDEFDDDDEHDDGVDREPHLQAVPVAADFAGRR